MCLCALNVCLCMHAALVCLSLTIRIIMCELVMARICVRVCVCVYEGARETTNNTMLTKIQGCAFVKVTSIHLAWQSWLYLFSWRHKSHVLFGYQRVDCVTWGRMIHEMFFVSFVCVNDATVCVWLKTEPKSLQFY